MTVILFKLYFHSFIENNFLDNVECFYVHTISKVVVEQRSLYTSLEINSSKSPQSPAVKAEYY